ncbi:polymorphic toxin type 23 domain-containing protein [Epilithonimonas hispanica]|nr:polymorphic toxin type 23 domain-containing protein [Epilithonimonas hispanica]
MKLKLYSLYTFLFAFSIVTAQEDIEIPLEYSTSGYQTSSALKTTTDNTLVPTVNAEMNVNEAGALTYILPVEILKGLNNFQPNIALAYNSQSGNGQAGWGWNIVGLSVITRGGKSKDIDGLTIGPQFNDGDPFYLDGQRLIKNSDNTYSTEKFSKIKIRKPLTGEFSFIIQYTDGRIAKFKELTTGQHYISIFIDSFNNEIHYTYLVENNTPRITRVSYGGTSSSNDKFYIDFVYKTRKKNIQIYRNGIAYINSKVLSEINTGSTYGSLYRKYALTHDFVEDNSIERIRTITVNNESGESLKPLNFNYNNSLQGAVKISSEGVGSLGYATGLGSVTVGDFTNSVRKIQPIYQYRNPNGYYLSSNSNLSITTNNAETQLFSGKVLDLNNHITEKDQLISVNESYLGTEDQVNPNNPVNFSLKDEINFEISDLVRGTKRKVTVLVKGGLQETSNYVSSDDPYVPNDGHYEYSYTRDQTKRELVQGDFNNDGLTDFLILEYSNLNRGEKIYFFELGKQNSSSNVNVNPIIISEKFIGKEIYPIEFDGDGLSELMVVNKYSAKYSIYKINFVTNTLDTILLDQPLSNMGTNTPIFFGDFNGDGLTDFLTPQKVYEIPEDDNSGRKMGETYRLMQTENLLWWKYTSNGKEFNKNQEDYTSQKIAYLKPSQSNYIKRSTFWQKFWNGKPDEYAYTRYSTHNIIVTDFNNDGRSDIITLNKIGTAKYNVNGNLSGVPIDNLSNTLMNPSGYFPVNFYSSITNRVNFYENKNLQGGTFSQLKTYPIENIKISPLSLILSSTEFDFLNVSKAGVYIFDPLVGRCTTIAIDNSNFLEKQIQEVDNGSTVLQRVDYRNMIPSTQSDEATYLYKPVNELKYPYYVHKTNSALYLVNKIHTIFDGKILSKEYRYENGIQHLDGKGFLGFQKTYNSDAYESELKNGKYVNKNPVKAVFWNIQTRDPQMENAIVKSTYGGINRFFTENTTINKKFDKGNHQYLILSTDEISQDNLKKITISKKYDYDLADDLKLKTAYTDYNGVGSAISKYTYQPEFSNADHHFYGKIATIENTVYKDGLSFTTKEESTYFPNGAIKENKKYGNNANAPPIITSYTYDTIGNLKTQTLSTAGVSSQTTTYDYDTTNRYVNKTTTPDGLSSTSVVNFLGRVSSEISPLGLSTNYTYDVWGNITEITDYLGKKTTISKSIADASTGGIYNLHKKREGGTETIVTFDKFNREIISKTQSINNKWLVSKAEYDIFGRKTRFSESFFEGEIPKWNSVEYDELSRPIKNIAFTGKTITTCYEGMKVTVDDGFKKTSKTLDAMGHIIRHQDHGGVIAYYYFPNGALRETNYEGIKTTFEIDGWGNKTKITDPSAGVFTYEYDNLSRITKEENPKGTTVYTYDTLGRPLTETITGKTTAENTNISKTYSYNANTKLPETITGTSNGKTYTYTTQYDNYFRIKGKIEKTPDFTYFSSTTFDSFGRTDEVSISTVLINPSYTSSSKIKNIYDANGILVQQNDVDSGKMVWHISDINSKGQTTEMEYGNGYKINNTYSTTNFSLKQISHNHQTSGVNVLDISYDYNVDKGVLNSRNNATFSKNEQFTYDKLNRLLTETVNNVLVNEYTFDKRGRITSNTELGKYNYNESDYKLQNIAFNTNGQNVNAQRGFADVKYNAFKSPLQITLAGKENLSFEYNILKTRYAMVSSVTGKQKYYSSDFAIEITKDNTGKTQIVTYITGDPYSANYIKKEVLSGTTVTEKANYFLHRDNIGSIVAITKADNIGTVVEKRFFDAWGNLKALVNSAGQTITDAQQLINYNYFIDRGYTGHEHLWKAGLINMNARIYDPIIRKFLSPDNLVSDIFNTQTFDRYSYVLNNPLLYIDIDGNEPITFGVAVLIAVGVAIVSKAIANMIQGIPFWYGLGKAATMGAISGAISFGIGSVASSFTSLAPVATSTQEAILSGLGQIIGMFLPSWEVQIGDWTFSLNISLYLGKSVGVGLSGSISYSDGHFSASYGVSLTGFGKHYGTGKSGWEMRNSFMLQYGSKEFSLFVGTNLWSGNTVDKSQQTGIAGIQSGDVRIAYENDGSPFGKGIGRALADNEDRFRTNAVRVAIGKYSMGINLFTGERNQDSYAENGGQDEATMAGKTYPTGDGFFSNLAAMGKRFLQAVTGGFDQKEDGGYGSAHPLGGVLENGTPYRLGAFYIGYGNYRIGIDSDRYVRHVFQDIFAHYIVSPQPGFNVLSPGLSPYFQYQTNNPFTAW